MGRDGLLFPLNENIHLLYGKYVSAGPAAYFKTYQSASADTRG